MSFSASVSPACLPSSALNNYDNVQAEVTGWGKLSDGGALASKLQKVKKLYLPWKERAFIIYISKNKTTLRHTYVVCNSITS